MNPATDNHNHGERIGRLEISVEGLHSEFSDIRQTLKTIQDSVSRSRETNWSVVLAGLAVVGSLYAAAVRPLEQDLVRVRGENQEAARALVTKEERATSRWFEVVKMQGDLSELRHDVIDIASHGSPNTDKRLAILEMQVSEQSRRK